MTRRRGLFDQRTAPYTIPTGWGHTPALYRYPLDLVRFRVAIALLAGIAFGVADEAEAPPAFDIPTVQLFERRI